MKRFLAPCLLLLLLLVATSVYATAQKTIRVASYNIRNGIGIDDINNLQRTIGAIVRLNPDILALQEVDSATVRSSSRDILKELSTATSLNGYYSAAIPYQGGAYGIGVLCKERPLSVERVAMPGSEEPRTLICLEFADYYFVCSHFSLTAKDVIESGQIVSKKFASAKKPVIFAGDLNVVPTSEVIESLSKDFTILSDTTKHTYPANNPNTTIDYIMISKNSDLKYRKRDARVAYEPTASDHRPIYVDLLIATKPDSIFVIAPYLQNPSTDGITISWTTQPPTHSFVEYGTTKDNLDQVAQTYINGQVLCNNTNHNVRLEGLRAATKYYYRVVSKEILYYGAYNKQFGNSAISDIYSFTTAPTESTNFTALILNDLHKNREVVDALTSNLKGAKFNFVVLNGDCIDDPASEADALQFMSHLHQKIDASNTPLIYLRGNHEIRNSYSIKLSNLVSFMGGKPYGAFNWGATHFTFLDCGEDKPDSTWVYYGLNNFTKFREDQSKFITQEIKSKEFKRADKRILLHHIPLYGNPQQWHNICTDLWSPLLLKAPYNLAINAHTHSYRYIAKGQEEAPFPVVIGGGNKLDSATAFILTKTGATTTLHAINCKGELLLDLVL